MSGKAMLTTVTSRKPTKTATDVTIRTFQRRSTRASRRSRVAKCKAPYPIALRFATDAPRITAMPLRTYDQNCSIARTLQVVGERWTLLVLREAFTGHRRFEEIQRQLGAGPDNLPPRPPTPGARGVLRRPPPPRRPRRGPDRPAPK